MSSNHRSASVADTHRVWMGLVISLFLLAASGCSGPPTVQRPGIVFPVMARMSGDLDCIDVLAHAFVTTKNLADQLWPLPIVYSSLLCFFSCTLWLIFFE